MSKQSKQAIFRCDATESIGAGHLMRCSVLADRLIELGWNCTFISCDQTISDFSHIFDKKFTFKPLQFSPRNCDLLVIDHYSLDRNYETLCRKWAKSIFVIDDLANRMHDCDYLLDQTQGRHAEDYKKFVPSNCIVLLGPKYALLRQSFAEKRAAAIKNRMQTGGDIKTILISLGSTNLHQITEKVLRSLHKHLEQSFNLTVVMGSEQYSSPEIHQLVQKIDKEGNHQITLLTEVSNIDELMLNSELAIGAGGTTSWERCCLGLPTIIIELADNQIYSATQLDKLGAAINLGWHEKVKESDISNLIKTLCHAPQQIISMQNVALKICDGLGANRISTLIDKNFSHA